MSVTLRPELAPPPDRIKRLPVRRGYPVPWFVEWIVDGKSVAIGTGEPDFRIMSHERLEAAVRGELCWVCGQRLGSFRAFVVGPMCAVNRTSAEPPSHVDCAEWSARNCPFLTRPHMHRREGGIKSETVAPPGIALQRNPGVALVWVTKRGRHQRYRVPESHGGGELFNIGDPERVSWWAEGREATREEVMASITSGLPSLREVAEPDGPRAVAELAKLTARALELVPASAGLTPRLTSAGRVVLEDDAGCLPAGATDAAAAAMKTRGEYRHEGGQTGV